MLTLITARNIAKSGDLLAVIEKSIAAGIDAIILREKDLSYGELLPIAEKIKELIGDQDVLLIINSNLEVAEAVGADGFHLGYEAFIKEQPKFKGFIGVSVHSLEEAQIAEEKGASYLLASHVFETKCKEGLAPKGLGFIDEIKSTVTIPVIALGGITLENIKSVVAIGVAGVAIMSGIMAADDPYKATKAFKENMK